MKFVGTPPPPPQSELISTTKTNLERFIFLTETESRHIHEITLYILTNKQNTHNLQKMAPTNFTVFKRVSPVTDNDVDICTYLPINIHYTCMITCICLGNFVHVMLKRNVCATRLFLDKN